MTRLEGSNSLADLAGRIKAKHNGVLAGLKSALENAIAAGELLIEAKKDIPHGQWATWLKENCAIPARTARHYMRLAKSREALTDQNGNVLPISVNEAVGMLTPLADDGVSQPLKLIDPRIEIGPTFLKLPDDLSREAWLEVLPALLHSFPQN